jgi:hypothetical protein
MRHTSRVASANVRTLGQTSGAVWKNLDIRKSEPGRPHPHDLNQTIAAKWKNAFDAYVILSAIRQREQKPLAHGDAFFVPCE